MKNSRWLSFIVAFVFNLVGLYAAYIITEDKKARWWAWRGFWFGSLIGLILLFVFG